MDHAQWLAGHMLVDPDGNEVQPGATLPAHRADETMTFHAITRAPGDGTGTNGKIDVTITTLDGGAITSTYRDERYQPLGYRIVPRAGFDPDA